MSKRQITVDDVRLEMTGSGCPEQYDALVDDQQVAYLRLRHGQFRVDYPKHKSDGGAVIYEGTPEGDGVFKPHERRRFLLEAKQAIVAAVNAEADYSPNDNA